MIIMACDCICVFACLCENIFDALFIYTFAWVCCICELYYRLLWEPFFEITGFLSPFHPSSNTPLILY